MEEKNNAAFLHEFKIKKRGLLSNLNSHRYAPNLIITSPVMFEAHLDDSAHFRKIIDSIKDLVKNVNIDVTQKGLSIQAMDSCHIALVSLQLKEKAFRSYNCQKPLTLGLAIENVAKILKIAGSDDSLTLSCED